MAVAAIEHLRTTSCIQVIEGGKMGSCQVLDVNIVPHTGAIRRRVVSAEHLQLRTHPKGRLGGHFDQMGGVRGGLPDATTGVGTGHIEVPQDDAVQIGCSGHILNHALAHHFGSAIGIDRIQRLRLADQPSSTIRLTVYGRRGGKDHLAKPVARTHLQQVEHILGVVAKVLDGLLYRFRHHDEGRKVQRSIEPMLGEKTIQQVHVREVPNHQFDAENCLTKTCGKVIQHHHLVTRFNQLPCDMAADVSGASSYQQTHSISLCH